MSGKTKSFKTNGVVLKQMPLGEADRILTICTPYYGKLRAVAKGVRRTNSKLGGHLETLTHVSVSVAEGRTLDVITEAETIRSFRGLREDLQLVSKALYVADLVDGFLVEQLDNVATFSLLLDTLGRLEQTTSPSIIIKHFQIQLLKHTGFGPELYQCVECLSQIEPGGHIFCCIRGGLLCPKCCIRIGKSMFHISLNAIKVLRYLQRDSWPDNFTVKVPIDILHELELLLNSYVNHVLERELKSTRFMNLVSCKTQKNDG